MVRNLIGISVSILIMNSPAIAGETTDAFEGEVFSQHKYSLNVIEDRGGHPTSEYLPKKKDPKSEMIKRFNSKHKTSYGEATLPVRSKSLTVGHITQSEAAEMRYEMMSRPMFIVGYDPVSLKWLKDNKDHLIESGAVGLVVNVETQEQLSEMRAIVGDVPLQPTPGDEMAKHIKVKHYPFYVDRSGVMR